MKGTDIFQKRIKDYLDRRAFTDPQFAEKYANPKKSVKECCEYICGEVSKSKQNGWDDDEIFGMAVHYYDEENITVAENDVQRVVTNEHIDLTEEEKEEARKQAIAAYQKEVVEGMKRKPTPKPKEEKKEEPQLSLF
jgi:hypothetical protein